MISRHEQYLDHRPINSKPEYSRIINNTPYKIIIPVCGRLDSAKVVAESLRAADRTNSFSICFSEISDDPLYADFCEKNNYDYLYSKNNHDMFNKSRAMNNAALAFKDCEWFLFHDVDCVVNSIFFSQLWINVKRKNAEAIQTFHGRRVLYANEELSASIKEGKVHFDILDINYPGISEPVNFGAPGGSIFIKRDLFFYVGGYDAEFFWGNSPEDAFFWNKVNMFSKMEIADDPAIDIFHLYHEPTESKNCHAHYMIDFYQEFQILPLAKKFSYVEKKKRKLLSE